MLKYLTILMVLAAAHAQDEDVKDTAVAYITDPTEGKAIIGEIFFTKTDSGISIVGTVEGLTEGSHGFHIHELGDLSVGCNNTGSHFNPDNNTHGAHSDKTRHAGDLGNIVANAEGIALVNLTDSIISFEGTYSVIGRALVVHADEDDLGKGKETDSHTTGHAGAKIACGVIGIKYLSPTTSGSLTFTMFPLLFLAPVFLLLKF